MGGPRSPVQGGDRDAAAMLAAETLLRVGQAEQARIKALPLLKVAPLAVRARAVLGNAAALLGDFGAAVEHYRLLLAALPQHAGVRAGLAMALNNFGSLNLNRGDTALAEKLFREALSLDEQNLLAWFNLGVCAQARNAYDEACSAFGRVLALEPARHEARLRLALCERLRGGNEAALANLRALAGDNLPAEMAVQIGTEFELLDAAADAQSCYAQAEKQAPSDSGLLLRIALAQIGSGDAEAARALCARIATTTLPDGLALQAALLGELALPAVPRDRAAIDTARAAFGRGVDSLAAQWTPARLAASDTRLDDLAHSHYELGYQGQDDCALASRFGDWYAAAAAAIAARSVPITSAQKVQARRIALVSSRWTMSTISAYFGAWIEDLASAGFEVYVYHLDSRSDAWTTEVARRASVFRHLPGPLEQTVAALRADAPALILYPEIGLNPRVQALAALRLAPMQVAAWGHPVTTGLPSIDAFFSCAEMEPQHGTTHYREQLLLLPRLGTRYQRPAPAAALTRADFGLPEGRPLYIAAHAPVKLHPDFDAQLAAVAQADPNAAIVMFRDHAPALTTRLVERMALHFREQGLDLNRHLLLQPRTTLARFRALLGVGAVLLDAPHFSGGNTTLDAIAQGLPVVTLPGATMRGRQSAAMLRLCGVDELVATDPAQWVKRAVQIANDPSHAASLRTRLMAGAAELFDDARPGGVLVEHVERLLA